MNITALLLSHWYFGCALIGMLFTQGLYQHARMMNPEKDEAGNIIPQAPFDLNALIADAFNCGGMMSNFTALNLTKQTVDSVIAEYERGKATGAAAQVILNNTVPPPQGS